MARTSGGLTFLLSVVTSIICHRQDEWCRSKLIAKEALSMGGGWGSFFACVFIRNNDVYLRSYVRK